MTETKDFDTLVVGGGMAGLVAGVQAVETDIRVAIIEKGNRLGGSMYLSGGNIWTYNSYDEVRSMIPNGNPLLQQLVVDSLSDGWEWLEEHGVEFTDTVEYSGEYSSKGRVMNPTEFTKQMRSTFEANGGEVFLDTPMTKLLTDDVGNVIGARSSSDSVTDFQSKSVVIATGGFQGSEELVNKYITQNTESLRLRSNPWSTGDGFEAARDVGAKASGGLDKFYGHSLCGPSAEIPATRFTDASQFYGPQTIALDQRGKRFTDESSASPLEGPLALDIAKHTNDTAYLVLDNDVYESSDMTSRGRNNGTTIQEAEDVFGGQVAEAESITKLGEDLRSWEIDHSQTVQTIRSFNEAVKNGGRLDPPRQGNREPVDTPPFYIVAVEPGITFTMGGLAVGLDMNVIQRAGSSSSLDQEYVPESPADMIRSKIKGLYAAGVDVGNISHRHYLGGLAQALTTGRIAGREAAEYAATSE